MVLKKILSSVVACSLFSSLAAVSYASPETPTVINRMDGETSHASSAYLGQQRYELNDGSIDYRVRYVDEGLDITQTCIYTPMNPPPEKVRVGDIILVYTPPNEGYGNIKMERINNLTRENFSTFEFTAYFYLDLWNKAFPLGHPNITLKPRGSFRAAFEKDGFPGLIESSK